MLDSGRVVELVDVEHDASTETSQVRYPVRLKDPGDHQDRY
jgi:hypothetical protein